MTLSLEMIEGIKIIIIAIFSYIPTVTFAGFFEAWVAKKCNDNLPEDLGFLSLHPFAHFNVIGFTVLLIGQLFGNYLPFFQGLPGWGRYIPLNTSTTTTGKACLQFLARSIAHFFMLLFSLIIIISLVKINPESIISATAMGAYNQSIMQSALSILVFFHNQNFLLCVIYGVVGIFRIILFSFNFSNVDGLNTKSYIIFFATLIAVVLIGSALLHFGLNLLVMQLGKLLIK